MTVSAVRGRSSPARDTTDFLNLPDELRDKIIFSAQHSFANLRLTCKLFDKVIRSRAVTAKLHWETEATSTPRVDNLIEQRRKEGGLQNSGAETLREILVNSNEYCPLILPDSRYPHLKKLVVTVNKFTTSFLTSLFLLGCDKGLKCRSLKLFICLQDRSSASLPISIFSYSRELGVNFLKCPVICDSRLVYVFGGNFRTQIIELSKYNTRVFRQVFTNQGGSFENLQTLRLEESEIDEHLLEGILGTCKALKDLKLLSCRNLRGSALSALASDQLKAFSWRASPYPIDNSISPNFSFSSFLDMIGRNSQIQEIGLYSVRALPPPPIHSADDDSLCSRRSLCLENLHKLSLDSFDFLEMPPAIFRSASIQILDLRYCKNYEASFIAFPTGLPNLREVVLWGLNASEQSIHQLLKSSTNLTKIDVVNSALTFPMFDQLEFRHLTELSLRLDVGDHGVTNGVAIDQEQLFYLLRSAPRLTKLSISSISKSSSAISDALFVDLPKFFEQLRHLTIANSLDLDDRLLCRMSKRSKHLKTLAVFDQPKITIASLDQLIANCPNLSSVVVYKCDRVNERDLRRLRDICKARRANSLLSPFEASSR